MPKQSDPDTQVTDFCIAFHTTTRKYMDGLGSVVLYNTINLMSNTAWGAFGQRVFNGLSAGKSLADACADAVEFGDSLQNLLSAGFQILHEEEGAWKALESGIRHYGAWPTGNKAT